MFTSLSALLVALLSRLAPAAEMLLMAQAQLGAVQPIELVAPSLDLGDAVAVVQVELLPDPDGAEQLAANLEQRLDGRSDVFVEVVPGDFNLPPSYRVNVGPFDSFEDAERALVELESLGVSAFVRELQPMVGC
jgi:hypothetical protein